MSWWGPVFVLLPGTLGLATAVGIGAWSRRKRLAGRKTPLTQGLLRAPGHELRRQLDDVYVDLMAWFMIAVTFPAIIGMAWFGATQRDGTITVASTTIFGSATVIAIGIAAYKLFRLIARAIDLRTGYEAELATGQELDQLMRRGAVVFHDLPCDRFNIDHIVVSTAGVFAVETKSRLKTAAGGKDEAKVRFDGNSLFFPGWQDRTSVEQARRQATWLAHDLRAAIGETIPVTPVLALPGWFVERTGRSDVRVLNPKQFAQLLSAPGAHLAAEQVRRVTYQLEKRCRDVEPGFQSDARRRN